jgi:hypothetical protein
MSDSKAISHCLRESLPDAAALSDLLQTLGTRFRAVAGSVWLLHKPSDSTPHWPIPPVRNVRTCSVRRSSVPRRPHRSC